MKCTAFFAATLLLGLCACGGSDSSAASIVVPLPAPLSSAPGGGSRTRACRTLDYAKDPRYNKLNGISNDGVIVGRGTPSGGYVLSPPYRQRDYRTLHSPEGVSLVPTAVQNTTTIAGYVLDPQSRGASSFLSGPGLWTLIKDGNEGNGRNALTEIRGLNDASVMVGSYTDERGLHHGFQLNLTTEKFRELKPPGGIAVEARGINGRGEIVGYMMTSHRFIKSFFLKRNKFIEFSYPGSADMEALDINARGDIVGSYVDAAGLTHGFILTNLLTNPRWQSFDAPNAVGLTVLSGINDHGNLVGYYADAAGDTNGFLCT